MSIGIFVDQARPPSAQALAKTLGAKLPLWEALTDFLLENYQMPGELTFGGKNYGWQLWYRKSGKTLISLYPQKHAFVAQVILGAEQVEKALALALGQKVGRLLRETPQWHDGRWLFIPVTSKRDVKDVEQLIQLKRRPGKPKPGG